MASPAGSAPAGVLHGRLWFWVLVAVLAVLDLVSKRLVFAQGLAPSGRNGWPQIELIPDVLSFVQVRNQGTIFGLFPNVHPVPLLRPLVWARIVAVGVLVAFLRRTRPQERLQVLALALILAGALGNLHDNLFEAEGAVRDFIQVYLDLSGGHPFHAFNVADACITVGASLLLLGTLRRPRPGLPAGPPGRPEP